LFRKFSISNLRTRYVSIMVLDLVPCRLEL